VRYGRNKNETTQPTEGWIKLGEGSISRQKSKRDRAFSLSNSDSLDFMFLGYKIS
jgi:hypothetical protein